MQQYIITIIDIEDFYYFGPFTLDDHTKPLLENELDEYNKISKNIARGIADDSHYENIDDKNVLYQIKALKKWQEARYDRWAYEIDCVLTFILDELDEISDNYIELDKNEMRSLIEKKFSHNCGYGIGYKVLPETTKLI